MLKIYLKENMIGMTLDGEVALSKRKLQIYQLLNQNWIKEA